MLHFRKALQQGAIALDPNISFTDETFGSNLFLSGKIGNHVSVIVKMNTSGIHGGRLVLCLFYILNM